jgi:hypothetical protein
MSPKFPVTPIFLFFNLIDFCKWRYLKLGCNKIQQGICFVKERAKDFGWGWRVRRAVMKVVVAGKVTPFNTNFHFIQGGLNYWAHVGCALLIIPGVYKMNTVCFCL